MKLIAQLLIAATAVVTPFFASASEAAAPAAEHASAPAAHVEAKVVKPDLAKGEASFGAVCAACHAADGNSGTPANPKLAQQHPEYLVKQLQEFKSGKRNNAIMKGFASALSDEDMRNIAYWLGGQHAEYAATQLTAFRDGVRKNSLQMTQIAAKLNDREIKAVSDYIAGLR